MRSCYALFAIVTLGVCVPVSAQNLKPGLWEMMHNVKSASGELEKARAFAQQQMANMPPEQRRMMEEAMAKHGVQMGRGGETSMKTCLTREMVERNEMPAQHGNCKTTRQQRTGNTLKVVYECTKPPSTTESEYTFESPEAFTMKTIVNTTTGDGRRDTMTVDGSGKWISADCGKLKPVQPPGKK